MRRQRFSSPAREKRRLRSLKTAGKHSFVRERKFATLFESTARSRSTRSVVRSADSLLNTLAVPVHQTLLPVCKCVVRLFEEQVLDGNQANLKVLESLPLAERFKLYSLSGWQSASQTPSCQSIPLASQRGPCLTGLAR